MFAARARPLAIRVPRIRVDDGEFQSVAAGQRANFSIEIELAEAHPGDQPPSCAQDENGLVTVNGVVAHETTSFVVVELGSLIAYSAPTVGDFFLSAGTSFSGSGYLYADSFEYAGHRVRRSYLPDISREWRIHAVTAVHKGREGELRRHQIGNEPLSTFPEAWFFELSCSLA